MKKLTKSHDLFIEYLWNELNNEFTEIKRNELENRIVNRWNLDTNQLSEKQTEIVNTLEDYKYSVSDTSSGKLEEYYKYIMNGGLIDDNKIKQINQTIQSMQKVLTNEE